MLDPDAPESPENLQRSLAFADGFYSGIQLVKRTFDEFNGLVDGTVRFPKAGRVKRDKALSMIWSRTRAWLHTFDALNQTKHYQAMAVGCRTLFETFVDVALVHNSTHDEAAEKMFFHAESAKLKNADIACQFFANCKLDVPAEYAPLEMFVRGEKQRIENQRSIYWPNRKNPCKHPERWSGNSSLEADVDIVDRLCGTFVETELNMTLAKFYNTEYRKINWHIHSGMAGIDMMPAEFFDITAGFALKWSSEFASMIAKMIMIDLELNKGLPNFDEYWKNLKFARDREFVDKKQNRGSTS